VPWSSFCVGSTPSCTCPRFCQTPVAPSPSCLVILLQQVAVSFLSPSCASMRVGLSYFIPSLLCLLSSLRRVVVTPLPVVASVGGPASILVRRVGMMSPATRLPSATASVHLFETRRLLPPPVVLSRHFSLCAVLVKFSCHLTSRFQADLAQLIFLTSLLGRDIDPSYTLICNQYTSPMLLINVSNEVLIIMCQNFGGCFRREVRE
jgi:hypothetical protein